MYTRNKMINKVFFAFLFSLMGIVFLFTGCVYPYGGVLSVERSLIVEVPNRIFSTETATDPQERGLSLSELTLTAIWSDHLGGEKTSVEKKITVVDLIPDNSFTPVDLVISGSLIGLNAVAVYPTGTLSIEYDCNTLLDEIDAVSGLEHFSDVTRILLTFDSLQPAVEGGSYSKSIAFLPLPLGYQNSRLLVDCGVQEAWCGVTDRADTLTSLQCAVEVKVSEMESDLTVELFGFICDEDLRMLYDEKRNVNAYYTDFPWTDGWSIDEIMISGRRIGSITDNALYKMSSFTDTPLSISNPHEDGKKALLLTLETEAFAIEGESSSLIGKYLVLTAMIGIGQHKIPTETTIVKIK